MPAAKPVFTESRLLLVIGLVQFVNILDFMMVMPLGPDFARALDIPAEHIGVIGGTYTLTAALMGLIAAMFLDRFNRKCALLVTLAGLGVATAAAALAYNLSSLIAARALAGIFGGPTTALAIAMIADHIPPERRGQAMGKVMGAFAVASVLGVPFGLQLALMFGWQAPFIGLAAIIALVWFLAQKFLPAHGNEVQTHSWRNQWDNILDCLKNPAALATFGYMSLAMMAGFMIIPNVSAHLQMNMQYPRADLGILYFCGGAVSFFSMRLVGRWVDRYEATPVALVATLLLAVVIAYGFIWYKHTMPALIFVGFMLAMTSRNVAGQTLSSKVPSPRERGSFMSLQSSMMHLGSALGAFLSSQLLTHTADGRLAGIENVGAVAIGISCCVPLLFSFTEARVAQKPNATAVGTPLTEI